MNISMNIQKLSELTLDEVRVAAKLQELVKEADEAATLIILTYRFAIGQDKLELFSDDGKAMKETLSHDGIWMLEREAQKYEVICTPEGIYDCLRAEYFVQHGLASDSETKSKAVTAHYFRGFMKGLKKAQPEMESTSPFVG